MKPFLFVALMLVTGPSFAQWTVATRIGREEIDFKGLSSTVIFDGEVSFPGRVSAEYDGGRWTAGLFYEQGESSGGGGIFLPDFSQVERTRIQAKAGFDVLPSLEVNGGFRSDQLSARELLGEGNGSVLDLDDQSVFVGGLLRTAPRRVGAYFAAKVARGWADIKVTEGASSPDSQTLTLEAGLPIQVGSIATTAVTLVPGVEHERFEAGPFEVERTQIFLQANLRFGP